MTILKYLLIFILSMIFLFPLYYMFKGSFEKGTNQIHLKSIFPINPTFHNYQKIIAHDLLTPVINSFILVILYVSTNSIIITGTAYLFAMHDFPLKKFWYSAFMLTLFIPGNYLFITRFIVIRYIGLVNNYFGACLPAAFTFQGIILTRNYIQTIPVSLIEAARIDGANEGWVIWHIILPLCMPMIITNIIGSALGALTDFLWQLIILQKEKLKPLITALADIMIAESAGKGDAALNIDLACGVLMFAPVLLVFIIGSRYFIKDLTAGGEK